MLDSMPIKAPRFVSCSSSRFSALAFGLIFHKMLLRQYVKIPLIKQRNYLFRQLGELVFIHIFHLKAESGRAKLTLAGKEYYQTCASLRRYYSYIFSKHSGP